MWGNQLLIINIIVRICNKFKRKENTLFYFAASFDNINQNNERFLRKEWPGTLLYNTRLEILAKYM